MSHWPTQRVCTSRYFLRAIIYSASSKQNLALGPDILDEVMTSGTLVEQAKDFYAQYGIKTWKLKRAVVEPELEVETMLKLREEIPYNGLRIGYMGACTVPAALNDAFDLAFGYLVASDVSRCHCDAPSYV